MSHSQEMADQCVPRSHPPLQEHEAGIKKCSINLRRKRVVCSPVENETVASGSHSRRNVPKRKKMRGRENQRDLYSRLQDVKVVHQRAKRSRPPVKDKRREIHRQNERFRHQSLNLAIRELAQLVPQSDHRIVDTKHNIVQRTGDFMQYLNNKISAMCRQAGVTTEACDDSLVFNKSLTAIFNGHSKSFPATKPINFSSLEELLQEMHIGSRVYSVTGEHQKVRPRQDLDMPEGDSKKSADTRKIKNKTIVEPNNSEYAIRNAWDNPGASITSPSLLIKKPVVARSNPVTPGYLGDSEETVSSPHGWTSSATFSSPAELSVQSQLSSDLESEERSGGVKDEAIMTMLGNSSVDKDHCYTSTHNPDLSDVIPFLLPGILEGLAPSDIEAGSSTAQDQSAQEEIKIRSGVGAGSPSERSSTSDGIVSSPAKIMPLSSADVAVRNETEVRIAVQTLGLLPGKNQLILPVSTGKITNPHGVQGELGQKLVVGGPGLYDRKRGDLIQKMTVHSGLLSSLQELDGTGATVLGRSWNDGYQLFFRVNHPNFHQAWPHLDEGELRKLLTQAWNDLPEDARKIYSDKAQESRGSNQDQRNPEQ